MTVYVVTLNIPFVGKSIIGIYSSFESANKNITNPFQRVETFDIIQ